MVDWYGRWTYEPNTPEEKKCDYDRMAEYIISQGYEPETDLENLITMIFSHYDFELEETGEDFTMEGCIEYINNTGSLADFDYYC